MEDVWKNIDCNDDDVLDIGGNTYKIGRLRRALHQSSNVNLAHTLQQQLNAKGITIKQPNSDNWFNEGMDCQILTLGSQRWKKGKVIFKVSVEFDIEDDLEISNNKNSEIAESESPLDDLRRIIHEENL